MNKKDVLQTLKIFGLDKLKDITLKSEREKREYGFRFCKNDEIKVTKMCKGRDCDLDLNKCPEENKILGSFHTHPTNIKGNINFLSDADIFSEATDKSEFACIGTIEDNRPKVKCYLPNYGIEKTIIDNRYNLAQEYNRKSREYNPSGNALNIFNLPPERQKELRHTHLRFLRANERLKIEASKSALRFMKEPNQGADLIIDL